MPGEKEYYKREVLIFDIPSKEINKVKLDPEEQQYISILVSVENHLHLEMILGQHYYFLKKVKFISILFQEIDNL